MIWLLLSIGVLGLISALLVWACCIAGAREDRLFEAFRDDRGGLS